VPINPARPIVLGQCRAYGAHQKQDAPEKKGGNGSVLMSLRIEAQTTDDEQQGGSDIGDDLDPFERPAGAASVCCGPWAVGPGGLGPMR
jgi:hypothetical protein